MEVGEVMRRLALSHSGVKRKAEEFTRLAKVSFFSFSSFYTLSSKKTNESFFFFFSLFSPSIKVKSAGGSDPYLTTVCVELACRSYAVPFSRDKVSYFLLFFLYELFRVRIVFLQNFEMI